MILVLFQHIHILPHNYYVCILYICYKVTLGKRIVINYNNSNTLVKSNLLLSDVLESFVEYPIATDIVTQDV